MRNKGRETSGRAGKEGWVSKGRKGRFYCIFYNFSMHFIEFLLAFRLGLQFLNKLELS